MDVKLFRSCFCFVNFVSPSSLHRDSAAPIVKLVELKLLKVYVRNFVK